MKPLTHDQNDDVPPGAAGAKFICERTDVATVSKWLAAHGWTVITSEIGFVPKAVTPLGEAEQEEVGAFLHALDDHDDVHRVWAAVGCESQRGLCTTMRPPTCRGRGEPRRQRPRPLPLPVRPPREEGGRQPSSTPTPPGSAPQWSPR